MRTKKQERKFKETGTNNYRFKIRPEALENGIIKKKNRSYFWKLWHSVYQTNLWEDENNELWGKKNSLQTLQKYPKAGRKNLTLERRGKYQSFSTQISHFSWGYFPVLMGWGSQLVLVVKNLPAKVGDRRDKGSIPGLRRSPGEGNGNPLKYSCLENPMNREAWQAMVHRVAKN